MGLREQEAEEMKHGLFAVAVATALSGAAYGGVWMDDFESYAPGTLMDNIGGWAGWDGDSQFAGSISDLVSYDGNNSLFISGAADAVHPFSGLTSGSFVITAQQYIPTSSFNGDTYFIVNNEYNAGGPYTWAIEIQFDIATGNVLDDFRDEANVIPIVFDEWVEISIEIDLDNKTQSTYYGGTLLSTGDWTTGAGDALEIANIDLFSTGGAAYYDGMSIIPAPGVLALLGLAGLAGTRRRRN